MTLFSFLAEDAASESHPDFSGTIWIEPTSVNNSALLFLTIVYGVILYQSSNLISSGSELLLLVPSMASLVGSIVLPILGAVPDGVMTLFSGMGPREEAQDEVSIGVGVLAGSTVMLLTFPWFIAVLAGRVPLDKNGEAVYNKKQRESRTKPLGLFDSGVSFEDDIKQNAIMMLGTTLIYLVIQVPAFLTESAEPPALQHSKSEVDGEAAAERLPALLGLFLSGRIFLLFVQMLQAGTGRHWRWQGAGQGARGHQSR
jgi:hypothetical protein